MKCLKVVLIVLVLSGNRLIAQDVEVIKFPQLQEIINQSSDKVKLINFWATWCKPCIEELPYFEEANKKYGHDGLEVILVSFDFSKDQVNDYIKKHQLGGKLYLLDETDFDPIINKIDKNWDGTIPATLIIDGDSNTRSFYAKQFGEGELDEIIKKFMK